MPIKVNTETGEINDAEKRVSELCVAKAKRSELAKWREEHLAGAKAAKEKIKELDLRILQLIDEPLQGELDLDAGSEQEQEGN